MPEGVEVTIEDGVATVVFTDPALRLPGVGALLYAAVDPFDVQKVTHPDVAYVVPESVARGAGLVDDVVIPPATPATPEQHGYDDGKPDMDWSRAAMDEYAVGLGIDPKQHHNKGALLKAIRAAEA